MESSRVKVDQQKKQYDFQIKGTKVFATCNEINRLSKPLQSRFRMLFAGYYTPCRQIRNTNSDSKGFSLCFYNSILLVSCYWKENAQLQRRVKKILCLSVMPEKILMRQKGFRMI
jgi:hypothetical protein